MQPGTETIIVHGLAVTVCRHNTIVVGSGAAGLNAAEYLHRHGQRDVAVVTEGLRMGTSRNTGSDKQTYYKLTLCGAEGDSVRKMAQTLFDGGSMDGDIALAEAAGSARGFYRLVELGVPFPDNAYGEFAGYKTDHDPLKRGTSCGPLTSKYMTECLEAAVIARGIPIYDHFQVIELLTEPLADGGKRAVGVLALNLAGVMEPTQRYRLFVATNVIYATGGEAGMYELSVYPPSQNGGTGVALRAGVRGKNLAEWQYGITSITFRWNLSGSYQQVLPRYVSTEHDGSDAREFLDAAFADPASMLQAIFLKGYQWPFDPRKIVGGGSSLIDILVYHEIMHKGRRVFMDYTRNPARAQTPAGTLDASKLTPEVHEYLTNSDALAGTPFDRLAAMNPAAVELYRSHGIDLATEWLEVAVSAQHNNGGLAGDMWWQSEIRHFFPIGEVNGAHGVYRPGGSALNSGQVSGMRAGQYILHNGRADAPSAQAVGATCADALAQAVAYGENALTGDGEPLDLAAERAELKRRMSRDGAHIRSAAGVTAALEAAKAQLARIEAAPRIRGPEKLRELHQLRDLAVCHLVYLFAISEYIAHGGGSRGSYLVHDPAGIMPGPELPAAFAFTLDTQHAGMVQEVLYEGGVCRAFWRAVRPIPPLDDWFESVWKRRREGDYLRD